MNSSLKNKIIEYWEPEILHAVVDTDYLSIAVFTIEGKLLFANKPMSRLLGSSPKERLLNPGFDKICLYPLKEKEPVFDGFITFGSYSEFNISLPALIYRKENQILILAREDFEKLHEQNKTLLLLNREINNLQRQLITEKKNLETTLKQLDETNRELTKINRQKDKFFSVIAHDLRSPFNSILGFAAILKENVSELSPDEIEKYTTHLYDSSLNTYNLLINLLEWASLQREAIRFNPELIVVGNTVTEVLNLLKEQAFQKSISIETHIPKALQWNADKNMLTIILRNLISNSIKFTPREGKINISARQTKNELEISVTDNGVGMPEEISKELFLNEFNETSRGTENEKGSGLGLALCKEFVEFHNGKIEVKSQLNEGTTITFFLPGLVETSK
ncbi:MAG: HAMP domain-containing histidine kinase [Prolixibacteraceae bacterium]|nr:HAMP domain-containing histidine kinase [Prolixibacteraceae bacterium]